MIKTGTDITLLQLSLQNYNVLQVLTPDVCCQVLMLLALLR